MSDYTCGTISSLNNTVTYTLGNMTLTNQRFATYTSTNGDSGSGAFGGTLAMGIHSGRARYGDGTVKGIYGHIGYAIQTLQLSTVNVT